jgi:hypothetical protein
MDHYWDFTQNASSLSRTERDIAFLRKSQLFGRKMPKIVKNPDTQVFWNICMQY